MAIGFFLLGLIKPSISYDSEIIVEKPVAESWAVSQDQEKLGEWLAGYIKVEPVSGTPGTVGAVSNVYFDNKGQEMVIKETIKDLVPEKSMSMLFENDFMNMDYIMSVTPVDGKTKINSSTTAVGNSWISRSMLAIMGSTLIEQENTNLAMLKKAIEQNTKNYFQVESEVETVLTAEEKNSK